MVDGGWSVILLPGHDYVSKHSRKYIFPSAGTFLLPTPIFSKIFLVNSSKFQTRNSNYNGEKKGRIPYARAIRE